MYLAFALDHIPRRMRELGYTDNYLTRYRHMFSEDKTVLTINAQNQFWYYIEPTDLKVESDRGVFDLTDETINVQQHEHSGKIKLSNDSGRNQWVLFIQVIPQHKKTTRS